MLVVLDTNIFLSALLSPRGVPATIYTAWRRKSFHLVTCNEQLQELRQTSRYLKFRRSLQPHRVGTMVNEMQRAWILTDIPRRHATDDPTDSYLLDLADFAKADYLVTGDKKSGLLQRGRIGRASIVLASAFCDEFLS